MTLHPNQSDAIFKANYDRLLREADMRRQLQMVKTNQPAIRLQMLDAFGDLLITMGQKLQQQTGEIVVREQPISL